MTTNPPLGSVEVRQGITHHSAGLSLDRFLHLPVRPSAQGLQELVAVFQVVFVVVLLHVARPHPVVRGGGVAGVVDR